MSSDPVRLGDMRTFVEVRGLEHAPAGSQAEGDLRLGVAVQMEGFSGGYDQIWIGKDEWNAFCGA